MLAEVISIGDELTTGQRLDTNSQWLSQRLGELGVEVRYHTTVADDLAANVAVFRAAVERADIVIASGGLGPTADDLTREALAQALGVELVFNEEVLERIRAMFAFFKRDMPERNRIQAMFPAGSRVIPNPHGTAPGIDASAPRAGRAPARVFALPGVPAELFEMWWQTVADQVRLLSGARRVMRHHRVKVFGAGESHVERMLPDLIRRGREPSVGITVSGATITLRITAQGDSDDECRLAMQPTIDTIYQCLGELVFGEEEDELEHAVDRLLVEHDATLAVAQWGTGSATAELLDSLAQPSGRFLGGVVACDAGAWERLLGLSRALVEREGSTSDAALGALAQAVRARFGAQLGLAVGPLPAPAEALGGEPPTVAYALARGDEVILRRVPSVGHPSIHKMRAAKVGLNLVRLTLTRG